MNGRIVLDFARRWGIFLGLLGGFYCLIAVTGVFDGNYGEWGRLTLFLAYAITPSLGPIIFQFDCLRGWRRPVQQLPVNFVAAVSLSSWCICVGIPASLVSLLTMPTAVFWSPDQYDDWFSLILATFSIVFASASWWYLFFPWNNLNGAFRRRSWPNAVSGLLYLVFWLSGFFLYIRWAGRGRSGLDFPFLYCLMAGLIFSVAGFWRMRLMLFGAAIVNSVSQRLGREPVKQESDVLIGGLTGWAHLTTGWIVRQAGLALGTFLLYLLLGAALHYYRFGEIAELQFGSATPAYSLPLLLAAVLVVLGYAAIAIEISSVRLLRTLPFSAIRGGLWLICSAFAAILCLVALVGVGLSILENKNNATGWLLSFVGGAGPASFAIPCALYLRDTVVSHAIPIFLVMAATIVWMHVAPLMELSTLGIVAPAVCVGGNVLSLLLVISIFSRSSLAYRTQGPVIQIGSRN